MAIVQYNQLVQYKQRMTNVCPTYSCLAWCLSSTIAPEVLQCQSQRNGATSCYSTQVWHDAWCRLNWARECSTAYVHAALCSLVHVYGAIHTIWYAILLQTCVTLDLLDQHLFCFFAHCILFRGSSQHTKLAWNLVQGPNLPANLCRKRYISVTMTYTFWVSMV